MPRANGGLLASNRRRAAPPPPPTDITVTLVQHAYDNTDKAAGAAYTTGSVTPDADTVYVCQLSVMRGSAVAAMQSVAGLGATWHLLRARTNAGVTRRLEWWYCKTSGSPTTGALTLTVNAATGTTGIDYVIVKLGNVLETGTDGIDAFHATNQIDGDTTGVATFPLTLPATPVADGAVLAFGNITDATVPSWDITNLGAGTSGTLPNQGSRAATNGPAPSDTATLSWSGSAGVIAMAVELVAA